MKSKSILDFLLSTLTAFGQDKNCFPKPSYFREAFSTSNVKVELMPPVRLSDFVVNGKLELSLRSYLELVMTNNTDIQVSRLDVETAKDQVLRGFAPFDPLATASFNNTRTKS